MAGQSGFSTTSAFRLPVVKINHYIRPLRVFNIKGKGGFALRSDLLLLSYVEKFFLMGASHCNDVSLFYILSQGWGGQRGVKGV
jgi:hypothetical protein